jgi:hypothetical protein
VASTAAELCELYEALFAGKLVHRDSLDEMTRLVRVPGEHAPAVTASYGLGLMADPDGTFGPEFGHAGNGPGYAVRAGCCTRLKGRRVAIAVLCNSEEAAVWSIYRALLGALEPQLGETFTLS